MSENRHSRRADRATEIAQLLYESDEWIGLPRPLTVRAVIPRLWPDATPAQIERGISIARELWRHDDAERAHRARLHAARAARGGGG